MSARQQVGRLGLRHAVLWESEPVHARLGVCCLFVSDWVSVIADGAAKFPCAVALTRGVPIDSSRVPHALLSFQIVQCDSRMRSRALCAVRHVELPHATLPF